MFKAVQKFRKKSKTLISFNELNEFPLNELIQIYPEREGSITTMKIPSSGEDLSFRVEMKKHEFWDIHAHNCIETILIYKGELHEHLTKSNITRMQPLVIKPFTDHIIEALEDSIFYVEFKNPYL